MTTTITLQVGDRVEVLPDPHVLDCFHGRCGTVTDYALSTIVRVVVDGFRGHHADNAWLFVPQVLRRLPI